jgi:hypothetical protein
MAKKMILLISVLAFTLTLAACSGPQDDRDTYFVTFVATYTIREVVDSWGNWPAYEEAGFSADFLENSNDSWVPPEGPFEVWKTVEFEYLKEPIQTNTLGRLPHLPEDPERDDDYYFNGWFTPGGTQVTIRTVFTSDTIVLAQWKTDVEVYKPLTEWLKVLQETAESGKTYEFMVRAAETMEPQLLQYEGVSGITIRLRGINNTNGVSPILTLVSRGSLFTIGEGVTLELSNVWLAGNDRNSEALVNVSTLPISVQNVEAVATLIMRQGPGERTMIYSNGGEDINSGGGVQVNSGGLFIMENGEIAQNVSFDVSGEIGFRGRGGGGILARGGTFVMYGGTIHHNYAMDAAGVMVAMGGKFYMYGGEIYDNECGGAGGGVHIYQALFEMWGGKIHRNRCLDGGGVFVNRNRGNTGSANPFNPNDPDNPLNDPKQGFFMYGGEIYGNGTGSAGGGVYNNYGSYTYIYDGKIYGNSSWSVAGIANCGYVELGRRKGSDPTFTRPDGAFTVNWGPSVGGPDDGPDIYDNQGGYGGGIDTFDGGTVVMWGGKVRDNIADGQGGGAMINAQFFMHGGVISGNQSNSGPGGGVYVRSMGEFFMTGGIIENDNKHNYDEGSTLYFAFDVLDATDKGSARYGTLDPRNRGNFIDLIWKEEYDPITQKTEYTPLSVLETTDYSIEIRDGVLFLDGVEQSAPPHPSGIWN